MAAVASGGFHSLVCSWALNTDALSEAHPQKFMKLMCGLINSET